MIKNFNPFDPNPYCILKEFAIHCPNCRQGIHFVNAEQLDPDYYEFMMNEYKKRCVEAWRMVQACEEFCVENGLAHGLAYKLSMLRKKLEEEKGDSQ